MSSELAGNSAVITGSSSGLGKASAKALAENGVNVLLNGRDGARLADAKAEVANVATGRVVTYQGDITDLDAIHGLISKAIDEFGCLDHLVTSAGGPPRLSFEDTTDEDWFEAFELLVMSVVRLIRESNEHLRADTGGTVVTITSMATKEPIPSNVLSGAVRATVVSLVKALATDFAPNVRVNSVLPGLFQTPRRADRGDPGIKTETDVPLREIGDPSKLGEVVAFLCSERSSYVTGSAIPVDGGALKSI